MGAHELFANEPILSCMITCILCKKEKIKNYCSSDLYSYLHCEKCDLVFVNPAERLPPTEEKERYDHHENDPNDPDYRNFLSQLFTPLNQKLKPHRHGLDYGSGPGPTLSVMFREAGHTMDIFDPFYANDPSIFDNEYDFITTTETVEHFYQPGKEFSRLWKLLKTGGTLGIMTHLRPKKESFKDWYYIREDTHVAFYSEKTFRWLADHLGAKLTIISERVLILSKQP